MLCNRDSSNALLGGIRGSWGLFKVLKANEQNQINLYVFVLVNKKW